MGIDRDGVLVQYPILSGSSIEIELPDELSILDTELTRTDSYTDGVADLSSEFYVSSSNTKRVLVNGAFV